VSENGTNDEDYAEPSPWEPSVPDPLVEHLENEDKAKNLQSLRAALDSTSDLAGAATTGRYRESPRVSLR